MKTFTLFQGTPITVLSNYLFLICPLIANFLKPYNIQSLTLTCQTSCQQLSTLTHLNRTYTIVLNTYIPEHMHTRRIPSYMLISHSVTFSSSVQIDQLLPVAIPIDSFICRKHFSSSRKSNVSEMVQSIMLSSFYCFLIGRERVGQVKTCHLLFK